MAKKALTFEAVSTKAMIVGLHLIGFAPVYITAKINYEAAVSQGPGWGEASVCFTILAAILVEVAILSFIRRLIIPGLVMSCLAAPLLVFNACTASGNATSADVHAQEVRAKQARADENRSDARRDAKERRDRNKSFADGETEESAKGKIETATTRSPELWTASKQCSDARRIARLGAQDFCTNIKKLQAKADAAKAYQVAVAELKKLDAGEEGGDVAKQATVEGAAANMAMMAMTIGFPMEKEASEKAFESLRGANLELAASIAPGLMTFLAWLLFGSSPKSASAASPISVSVSPKPSFRFPDIASLFRRKTTEPAGEVISFPPGSGREFYRRCLEPCGPGDQTRIKAGVLYKEYLADCSAIGVSEPLSQKQFCQEIKTCDGVRHGKDSGDRPYYYGVKFRARPLPVAKSAPWLVIDNPRLQRMG